MKNSAWKVAEEQGTLVMNSMQMLRDQHAVLESERDPECRYIVAVRLWRARVAAGAHWYDE